MLSGPEVFTPIFGAVLTKNNTRQVQSLKHIVNDKSGLNPVMLQFISWCYTILQTLLLTLRLVSNDG